MFTNVLDYLDGSVASYSDKIALSDSKNEVTYSQLGALSDSIGTAVIEKCKSKNAPVVVFIDRNIESVISFMGIAKSGKQSLVQHLSVSPAHRRKGLAVALMNRVLLSVKEEELTITRLWVDCENLSAVALYDRLGFQKDGMLCEQLYMKGF